MPRRCLWSVALSAAMLAAASPGEAATDAAKACASSFERSQVLLKSDKLGDARAEALHCLTTECPGFLRDACQKVLGDIDTAQPTVVLAAQDTNGRDLLDVRVELDGSPFVARQGPDPVPVDPGAHAFRFIHPSWQPVDLQVLLRQGEKGRVVRVAFSSPLPPATGDTRRGPLWPSLLVGAVGVGTISASAAIGVSAQGGANNLRNTCAPNCAPSAVADLNTRLIVSDVLLGAGVAVLATAVVLFFVRPGGHEATVRAPSLVQSREGVAFGFAF